MDTVRTPMREKNLQAGAAAQHRENEDRYRSMIAMRRIAQPSEIADAVLCVNATSSIAALRRGGTMVGEVHSYQRRGWRVPAVNRAHTVGHTVPTVHRDYPAPSASALSSSTRASCGGDPTVYDGQRHQAAV